MEADLVCVIINLLKHLHTGYKLSGSLHREVQFLLRELISIEDAIKRRSRTADDWIHSWISDLDVIRVRILDSVDDHKLKVFCKHNNRGGFRKFAHRVWTHRTCKKLLQNIEEIKQLAVDAKRRLDSYQPPQAGGTATVVVGDDGAYRHSSEAHPVGLEPPKADLVSLLSMGTGGTTQQCVLAISGPGGSGKTVLARALYQEVYQEFECKASVTAFNDPQQILLDIIDQFGMDRPPPYKDLSEHLRVYLQTKRYLLLIDDLRTSVGWDHIMQACPDNDLSSRIILTAANEEIARICRKNCRIYRMQPLDENSARDLLVRKAFGEDGCPENFKDSLPKILKTCEYLPLSIVCMAHYIRSQRRWDNHICLQVCNDFASLLVSKGSEAFTGMNKVLSRTYNSLSYNARVCLQSLSTYPKNQCIKRTSVIRKWLAQRLIPFKESRLEQDVANECFTALVDHNFIVPKKVSVSGQVKTFLVRPAVLEFIKDKANSKNDDTCIDTRVRSLTFYGQASKAQMDFKYSNLLRVLDLENCENLKDGNLHIICRSLSVLKYISIRGNKNVSRLPRNIRKLRCLETLDIRGTKIDILPMAVLLLPELAHLFGEFKIICRKSDVKKFLSEKNSKLQTLAGFFFNESPGFVKLLPHMPILRKLKILCRQADPSNEVKTDLLQSLKGCFERELSPDDGPLNYSLSIDFGDACDLDFLDELEVQPSFLLRSLELCGRLTRLPRFIQSLDPTKLSFKNQSWDQCSIGAARSATTDVSQGNRRRYLQAPSRRSYLPQWMVQIFEELMPRPSGAAKDCHTREGHARHCVPPAIMHKIGRLVWYRAPGQDRGIYRPFQCYWYPGKWFVAASQHASHEAQSHQVNLRMKGDGKMQFL